VAAAKIDFLDKAIRDHIQVGDSELQALGQQRAKAVQQVLLADSQVTPSAFTWWRTTRHVQGWLDSIGASLQ